MRPLLDELHAAIASVTGQSPSPGDWAPTPNRELGDVSFPCFKLAKTLGKAPPLVAKELAPLVKQKLTPNSLIREIVPMGPYLNVFFAPTAMHELLQKLLGSEPCALGRTTLGGGRNVVIDFSSPNTAKEMGLHHLRSTCIGHALANLAEWHGYKSVRINYLGDWGTSHGKNIMALKTFGDEARLVSEGLPYMLDLYVQYNDAIKKETAEGKTALADAAKDAFRRLEAGDSECRRIWALEREISVREMKSLYARLGIHFDHYDGESLYEKRLDTLVDEVTAKIGTRQSEGALVCDIPGEKVPVLLRKDDGASLYMTRDLVAAADRFERFNYALSWYVVAIQQKFHFGQLFAVLKLLGRPYADRCQHISFGMLSFGAKTMKSREGNLIFLSDVLDEARDRALKIIREKNPDLAQAEEVAEMIGQGAILFNDLSQNRDRDIAFNWEQALSFEGDTGPFAQYTHARCSSLLERGRKHMKTLAEESPEDGARAARELLESEASARQLLGDMAYFQTYSERAFNERDPSQIATAVLNVAKSFNQLYHQIRFLDERSPARLRTLLELTDGTRRLVAHGLGVLGIRAPQEM